MISTVSPVFSCCFPVVQVDFTQSRGCTEIINSVVVGAGLCARPSRVRNEKTRVFDKTVILYFAATNYKI